MIDRLEKDFGHKQTKEYNTKLSVFQQAKIEPFVRQSFEYKEQSKK